MKMKRLNITKKELDTVKGRTGEILQLMDESSSVNESLCRYAETHGYSQEEATELVRKVIFTVDEYNKECRNHIDNESNEWILEKIEERVAGMNIAEECKYKLGILVALRGVSKEILNRVAIQTSDQMETVFEVLSDDELEDLEEGKYTEEILNQINEQLAEAIKNSGIELEMTGQMDQLINGEMEMENVHGFVTDMWKDEQYKYVTALAACVSKKNNELPSIPEDAADEALIVGICQGIDVANIEIRVSNGELAIDKAYKILKVIVGVGLIIIISAILMVGGLAVAGSVVGLVSKVLGDTLVANVLALAAGGAALFGLGETFSVATKVLGKVLTKISDFTYDKLKKGVKFLYHGVVEHVVPRVKEMLTKTVERIREIVTNARRNRVQRTVQTTNA